MNEEKFARRCPLNERYYIPMTAKVKKNNENADYLILIENTN
jgi:hypothetical protein